MPVSYVGSAPLPDTFKDGALALVEGSLMPDGQFVAEQVQAKCASKYQANPTPLPARSSRSQVKPRSRLPRAPAPVTEAEAEANTLDIAGSFALLLAFIVAIYAFLAGIAGILTRRTAADEERPERGHGRFFLVTFAVGLSSIFSSLTISRWSTLPSTATARCPRFISLRRCGRGKKARYCGGRGCYRCMRSSLCS